MSKMIQKEHMNNQMLKETEIQSLKEDIHEELLQTEGIKENRLNSKALLQGGN